MYFIDLKNGATIPEKSTIHFGLHGMGVAPAGSEKANSGHHHLLIDTDLPPLMSQFPTTPITSISGPGQTEAEVTLSPGDHTLQLLLGDKDHIPHNPPVMSERIKVHVTAAADAGDSGGAVSPSLAPKREGLFRISHRWQLRHPDATIKFGLIGMGVAPAGFEKTNTGHHHLLIDSPLPPFDEPIPSDPNHLHFGSGQTEAKVTLPLGVHTLQLLLGDENHIPHEPPVYSKPIKVVVTVSGHPPVVIECTRCSPRHPAACYRGTRQLAADWN